MWASTYDAPTNFAYADGVFQWNDVEGAQVFEIVREAVLAQSLSDNAQLITAYHFTREDITVSGGIATYEPDTFLDGNYYLITYGNLGGTPAVNNNYTAQPFHPQTDWSWLNQSSKKKTTQPSGSAEITGLTAVPGDGKVALLWTDPVDPDFEAIVISWSPDDESVVIAPGVQEHTVTGLANGVEYSFVVRTRTYNGQPSRGLSVTVRPEFIPVIAISAGSRHVLALREDGTVWSWGWNTYGQMGDGTNELRTTAVQVQGLEDVVAVSTGGDYSLALKSDGTFWAWGNNAHGSLGNGTGQNFNTSVQIPSLADITPGSLFSKAFRRAP